MANRQSPLQDLEIDVERLLLAGAGSSGDLAKSHRQAIEALTRQVAGLQPVLQQLDRLGEGPGALLDLAVMSSRLRGARAGALQVGDLGALPGYTPMPTPLAVPEVERTHRALTTKGEGPVAAVWRAVEQKSACDLRLLGPWLNGLADPRAGDTGGQDDRSVAELIGDEIIPMLGQAAAEELLPAFNSKGSAADGRRLKGIAVLRGEAARALVLKSLANGSGAVRVAALDALSKLDPAAALARAPELIKSDKAEEVRALAARLVNQAPSGLDLDTLMAHLNDKAFQPLLVDALRRQPPDKVVAGLVRALTPELLAGPEEPFRQVIALLGEFRLPEGLAALLEAWKSYPGARYYAGLVILKYDDAAAAELLARGLDDGQTEYLQVAKVALSRIDPAKAYELYSSRLEPGRLVTPEGIALARAILEGVTGQELWGEDAKRLRPPDPRWLDRCRDLVSPAAIRAGQRDPTRTALVALGMWDADRSLPLVLEVWRTTDSDSIRRIATQVLLNLRRPEGLAVLAAGLHSSDESLQNTAIEAIMKLEPSAAYARFAPDFEAVTLATPAGLSLAIKVLYYLRNLQSADQDPRWMDRCVDVLDGIVYWKDWGDWHLRNKPVEILTRLLRPGRDPRWTPALLRALNHLDVPPAYGSPTARLRPELLTALWQLDDPAAVEGVQAWADRANPNYEERDAVKRMVKWLTRDRAQAD